MNPLEYMQTVKNLNASAMAENDLNIERFTNQLTIAQEYKDILSTYNDSCDQVIAILSQATA